MTRAQIEDSESEGEMSLPSRWLRVAWRLTRRTVYFLKALGAAAVLFGGALTDQYQLADVQGFIKSAFGSSVKLPAILAGVTVAYLALTVLLKLPKGFSMNVKMNDGE